MALTLKERLEAAMRLRPDISAADIARACGIKPPSVSEWMSGKTKSIKGDNLLATAKLFGVRPEWLSTGIGSATGRDVEPVSDYDATITHIPRSDFRRVPVVGTASLGMDGFWTDLKYPVGHGDGYFEFPTTDKDAYVLQVRGNSMHPAIRSGWYVVIEPNKQIQMGEFVMVKLVDGRSTVKEFLWHRDGEYVLHAIASGERLVIDEADIDAIHHVGGILPPSGRQG